MESLTEKDQQVEHVLGNLLLTGVVIAAVVVLAGGILYLLQHGAQAPEYTVFVAETDSLKDFSEVIRGALAFNSLSIIQLGILILIATPVMRVVFSVVAFLYERDYLYVLFTLIVLAILLYSLFL